MKREEDNAMSDLREMSDRADSSVNLGISRDYYLGIAEGFRQAHKIISAALASSNVCDHFACVLCIKSLPDPTDHSHRCPNIGKL